MSDEELKRKIRGRFAVGDVVVGTEKANIYGMTKEGVELRITDINLGRKEFRGVILDVSKSDVDEGYVGNGYSNLKMDCFTLK